MFGFALLPVLAVLCACLSEYDDRQVFARRPLVRFSPSYLNLVVRSLSLWNHYSNHFSRESSACLRIRRRRSTPISLRWGFGIVKVRSALTMYGCFPPRYGPSNPNFLSRLTRSSQETGVSLATDLQFLELFYPMPVDWRNGQAFS